MRRGPCCPKPATQSERRNTRPRRGALARNAYHRRLLCEALEDRRLLSIGCLPALPGMHLVNPNLDNLRGQIVYLDFDGAKDVDYNGPVTVKNIDVPAFTTPSEFAGKEQNIVAGLLDRLDVVFHSANIAFTTSEPSANVPYSTVYVGGNSLPFAKYGSFAGLAEDVDVGNRNPSDKAFVFSDSICATDLPLVDYTNELAGVVAHEVGHLVGYAHDSDSPLESGVLDSVAAATVNATLQNVNGSNAAASGTKFILYTSPSQTKTGSNPASFTNVASGTYWLEGYQTGTFWGTEYWGSKQVTVGTSTVNTTLTRYEPFATEVHVYNGNTEVTAGQSVSIGTTLQVKVTVKNNYTSALNSQVHLVVDRDQSSTGWDISQTSAWQSVSSSGSTFTFNVTPTTSGQFYYALEVNTVVETGSTCRTDSWTWTQTFASKTLAISSVTPSTVQVKDIGQSVAYTITVQDGSGNAVSGASVNVDDGLEQTCLQLTTNSSGQATYTTTVPNGKGNGTYNIAFTAAKSGYNNSSSVTRQVQVNHTLAISSVTPSAVQVKDIGQSVAYTITVQDGFGNAVAGASVNVTDGLEGTCSQLTTNFGGQATYTTTVPSWQTNGTYNIAFTAVKSGYPDSPSVTRQVQVQISQTLAISNVTPSAVQVKDIGQSVAYTITVQDGFGNAVAGASVNVTDGLEGTCSQLTTNFGGQATYTTTVPSWQTNGTYNIAFTAVKSGYPDSPSVTRQVQVQISQTLAISNVTPSAVQVKDIGQSVAYTITVQDGFGNAVAGASVNVTDGLEGTCSQLTTNFGGQATYTTTVPSWQTNGTYNIAFTAAKSGYPDSPSVTRQVQVQISQTLAISNVTPSAVQVKDIGQSVAYTITVQDGSGNAVSGASVAVDDGLEEICPLPLTTDGNGQATYTTTVPSWQTNGTYNLVFTASKSGYPDSPSVTRQVQVQISQTLAISSVTPSAVQVKDIGQSVAYTITVQDGSGNAVSGASVAVDDGLEEVCPLPLTTNSSGQATYTTTVPSWQTNGTYNLVFTASKSGYSGTPSVTRQVQVQISTDVGDTISSAQFLAIVAGQPYTIQDQIGNGTYGNKDVDLYKFTLGQSASVSVDVTTFEGAWPPANWPLEGYLRLFDASGNQIYFSPNESQRDAQGSITWTGTRIDGLSLSAGTYYVGISGSPNRNYSPFTAGSGVAGDTGSYTLQLTAQTSELPPPSGDIHTVDGIQVTATSFTTSGGTTTAYGTILLDNCVEVDGSLQFNGSDIWGNAGLLVHVGQSYVEVYRGDYRFDGQNVTDALNDTLSSLQVVGLQLHLDRLTVLSNGLQIEGSLALPDDLGGAYIDFAAPHYIDVTTAGVVYDFTAGINDLKLNLGGFKLSTTDAQLYVSNADGTADAILTGVFKMNILGTPVTVNLEKSQGNYFAFGESGWNLDGSLHVGRIDIVPNVFYMKSLDLDIKTSTHSLDGEVVMHLPLGTGVDVDGQIVIVNGYLDSVKLTASNMDVPIWDAPPVLLDTIGGEIDHLTPDDIDGTPPVITVNAGLQLGPDVAGYSVLYLDLTGVLDTGGGVQGTANIYVGNHDDPWAQGTATVVWVHNQGFGIEGTLNVGDPKDPYLSVSGAMRLDNNNGFQGELQGTAQIPDDAPIIGAIAGGYQVSARAYAQAYDDGDATDDYIIGSMTLPVLGEHAIEMNLDTGKIDWNANLKDFKEVVIPSIDSLAVPPSAGCLSMTAAADNTFTVESGTPSVIFRAGWETGNGDLELTAPDGTVITPANVGTFTGVTYYKNLAVPEAFYIVQLPAAGEWHLQVSDTTGMGKVTLDQLGPTTTPRITVLQPASDTAGSSVTITWDDAGSDPNATISLFYDTDRQGDDGVQIATGISAGDAANSYLWSTNGVPTGDYYVYAVIEDGANLPATSYSIGKVSVVDPKGPEQIIGLTAPEGTDTSARLTWDASTDPNLDHYLVQLTADAAGEGYEETITASEPTLTVDGLVPGETYRVVVAAVDVDGRVGCDSDPIVVIAGGVATVEPGAGQWQVFADPGQTYQAQVPSNAGDTFMLVDGPVGATLNANGLFEWSVPGNADGWYQVLANVTDSSGNISVHRYYLLADDSSPQWNAGTPTAEAINDTTIQVTSPDARDASGILQYQLERDGVVVVDWQLSPVFVNTGLQPNTTYEYRVQARDASPNHYTSAWSAAFSGETLATVPGAPILGALTDSSVGLVAVGEDDNPAGTQYSIYDSTTQTYVAASGLPSAEAVWQAADAWAGVIIGGLNSDTEYAFQAMARNGNSQETTLGVAASVRTEREHDPPTVVSALRGRFDWKGDSNVLQTN